MLKKLSALTLGITTFIIASNTFLNIKSLETLKPFDAIIYSIFAISLLVIFISDYYNKQKMHDYNIFTHIIKALLLAFVLTPLFYSTSYVNPFVDTQILAIIFITIPLVTTWLCGVITHGFVFVYNTLSLKELKYMAYLGIFVSFLFSFIYFYKNGVGTFIINKFEIQLLPLALVYILFIIMAIYSRIVTLEIIKSKIDKLSLSKLKFDKYTNYIISLLVILSIIAIYMLVLSPSLSNYNFKKALYESVSGDNQTIDERIIKTGALFEKALRYNNFNNTDLILAYNSTAFNFISSYGRIINNNKDERSITALSDFVEASMTKLKQESQNKPKDIKLLKTLASSNLNLQKLTEAKENYSQALALAPNNAELLIGLGKAELLAGNFDAGIFNYDKALTLMSKDDANYRGTYFEFLNALLASRSDTPSLTNIIILIDGMAAPKDEEILNSDISKILTIYNSMQNSKDFTNLLRLALKEKRTSPNLELWYAASYMNKGVDNDAKILGIINTLSDEYKWIKEFFASKINPKRTK